MVDFKVSIAPAVTGEKLKHLVNTNQEKRLAYAEGLFYEKTAVMNSADPGTGKSLLAILGSLQLASGMPLFGALRVPKPIKVYYIQKERPPLEVLERLRTYQETIDINWDNFVFDHSLKFVNFSEMKYAEFIAERILQFEPQLVVIDPIGAGLGGLSKDEIANNFCSMLTFVQERVGNAYWLNHHTVKEQHDKEGGKIMKNKPFYGSQWLDAYVTGHYHVTRTSTGNDWRKTKDNYNLLFDKLSFEYEADTLMSYLLSDVMTVKDKILNYINSIKSFKKEFKFSELSTATGCVTESLRHTLRDPIFLKVLEKHKTNGSATLYKILE